jgi:osmotically-inducible protein OsmY
MGAATDQAKSEADRTMNQNIRQTLNTDSALSASAKNVHFDTDNGKVILRGTVPTEKDKKDIEAKVEKMSGVKDVDNQLQIAPSTSSAADRMGSSSDMASSGKSTTGTLGSKSSPMGR